MSTEVVSPFEEVQTPWWLILVEGIVLVLAGILFLTYPGISALVAVRILGLYWLIAGIFKIVAILIDSSRWGWKLIFGVIGIIAGILVLQAPLGMTLIVGNVSGDIFVSDDGGSTWSAAQDVSGVAGEELIFVAFDADFLGTWLSPVGAEGSVRMKASLPHSLDQHPVDGSAVLQPVPAAGGNCV